MRVFLRVSEDRTRCEKLFQTLLPRAGETPNYNIPTGPIDSYSFGNETSGNPYVKGGKPSLFIIKFTFYRLMCQHFSHAKLDVLHKLVSSHACIPKWRMTRVKRWEKGSGGLEKIIEIEINENVIKGFCGRWSKSVF